MKTTLDLSEFVAEFRESLDISFTLPPEQAVAFFRAKRPTITYDFRALRASEHALAFTVAKLTDVSLLADMQEALDLSLAAGGTQQEFVDAFESKLRGAGWWGRREVINPTTGQPETVQLGSRARLNTIYRTNLQSAYAAGAWEGIQQGKEDAPYLLYDAVDDNRTRPEHAAIDGALMPVDHPYWRAHAPPNGYNCRCGLIPVSEDEIEALESSGAKLKRSPPRQSSATYSYIDPRTGRKRSVPMDVDPGFEANVGELYVQRSQMIRQLVDRYNTLPADVGAASAASFSEHLAAEIDRSFAGWFAERTAKRKARGEIHPIGVIPEIVASRVETLAGGTSAALYVTDKDLLHMVRDAKRGRGASLPLAFLRELPAQIRQARAILFDTRDPALVFVFDGFQSRAGKGVVRVGMQTKVRADDGRRVMVDLNRMKTAGFVDFENLREPRYELLSGEL